jgi:hypothetical protein
MKPVFLTRIFEADQPKAVFPDGEAFARRDGLQRIESVS